MNTPGEAVLSSTTVLGGATQVRTALFLGLGASASQQKVVCVCVLVRVSYDSALEKRALRLLGVTTPVPRWERWTVGRTGLGVISSEDSSIYGNFPSVISDFL
jgi:hypothetical protein